MIDLRFRPLADPNLSREKQKARGRSTFQAKYTKTLDDLERELRHLGARDIVIEAGLGLHQIRNDGWPYSSARPSHPAVRLSFLNKKGQSVSMPCDTYHDFESNIRAIALSLGALRAVDRYGVTRSGEQYRGWTALPAPGDGKMTVDAARAMLAGLAQVPVSAVVSGDLEILYRAAAKRVHPDAGGSTEAFQRLQDAMGVLRK